MSAPQLTRFAHSELPYPRQRDERGHTRELREYLRRKYGRPACQAFNCGCEDCRNDRLVLGPWWPQAEEGEAGPEEVSPRLQADRRFLAQVDWYGQVLLVGESPPRPARQSDFRMSPDSPSGRRLSRLLGRPLAEVGGAVNLLSRPGSDALMRRRALLLLRDFYARRAAGRPVPRALVLLGRRVSRAFGAPRGAAFFEGWEVPLRESWKVPYVYSCPHPSGRCRWWNDESNRARASAFFRRLAELAAWWESWSPRA